MRLLSLSVRLVSQLLLPALLVGAAEAASVSLQIGDSPDPDDLPLRDGADAIRPAHAETWLVLGRLTLPDFSIPDMTHARLHDAEGRDIPLIVETGTLHREFGDIVGMRVAFEFDPRALAGGLPTLTWGDAVTASNTAVAELIFPPELAGRIRSFSTLSPDGATEAAHVATIEIIADSQADRYYLWYLLPIVVIFGLLILRKRGPL